MGGIERVHPRPNIGCNADPIPIWDSALSNAPGLTLSFTHSGRRGKRHPLLAETTNPTRNKERYTQGLMRNNAVAGFISLVSSRNKPNSVRSKARLSSIGMS